MPGARWVGKGQNLSARAQLEQDIPARNTGPPARNAGPPARNAGPVASPHGCHVGGRRASGGANWLVAASPPLRRPLFPSGLNTGLNHQHF